MRLGEFIPFGHDRYKSLSDDAYPDSIKRVFSNTLFFLPCSIIIRKAVVTDTSVFICLIQSFDRPETARPEVRF